MEEVATKLWFNANTKKCPRCGATIEKDEGCNHMTRQLQARFLLDVHASMERALTPRAAISCVTGSWGMMTELLALDLRVPITMTFSVLLPEPVDNLGPPRRRLSVRQQRTRRWHASSISSHASMATATV